MPRRRTSSSPYREAAAPERSSPSPDIDPALLAGSKTTPLLVVSGIWVPAWLVITWFGALQVRVAGSPSRPETLTEKIVVTIVLGLWMAGLMWFRARHARRQRAALLALQSVDALAEEPLRVERVEEARLRVAPTETSTAHDDEEPPRSSHPARRQRSSDRR